MRIFIVRHGDPDYKLDTLTQKGKREAELLAEKLKQEKIDYFYTSPLGRAKDTCMTVAKIKGMENAVRIEPLFREFDVQNAMVYPNGLAREHIWDMLPEFWTPQAEMYDKDEWWKAPCFRFGNVQAEYEKVVSRLDEILAMHGYVRDGNAYRVEKPNRDTVIIFCHFGLEMMLLSRLMNISPVSLSHHFVALTSSLTTLYSEERREGIATFRCAGFGDIGHLYAGGEQPSFSARFCETYHSDERHD